MIGASSIYCKYGFSETLMNPRNTPKEQGIQCSSRNVVHLLNALCCMRPYLVRSGFHQHVRATQLVKVFIWGKLFFSQSQVDMWTEDATQVKRKCRCLPSSNCWTLVQLPEVLAAQEPTQILQEATAFYSSLWNVMLQERKAKLKRDWSLAKYLSSI